MKVLIGHTGLVGSTLTDKIKFDFLFNTKNIETFNNYNFDGYDLYLSCLPATKWMVNKNITYAAIETAVKKTKNNKLQSIRLFDVFESEKLGIDKKSIAINFTFIDEEKTLTDKEIDTMVNKLIQTFEQELSAEIRK